MFVQGFEKWTPTLTRAYNNSNQVVRRATPGKASGSAKYSGDRFAVHTHTGWKATMRLRR